MPVPLLRALDAILTHTYSPEHGNVQFTKGHCWEIGGFLRSIFPLRGREWLKRSGFGSHAFGHHELDVVCLSCPSMKADETLTASSMW